MYIIAMNRLKGFAYLHLAFDNSQNYKVGNNWIFNQGWYTYPKRSKTDFKFTFFTVVILNLDNNNNNNFIKFI